MYEYILAWSSLLCRYVTGLVGPQGAAKEKEVRGIDISVGTTFPNFTEKSAHQLNGNLKFPM
jgi:hypothetical protein